MKVSQYAPHIVADEKAKTFQCNLAPYIHERIAPFMIEDYSNAFEKALVIEKTTLRKDVGVGQPYSP